VELLMPTRRNCDLLIPQDDSLNGRTPISRYLSAPLNAYSA